MGLDYIFDEKGGIITNKSKGFTARSTGCGCCSGGLETESEVREEAINSLKYVVRASKFFKWNLDSLIKQAKKAEKDEVASK